MQDGQQNGNNQKNTRNVEDSDFSASELKNVVQGDLYRNNYVNQVQTNRGRSKRQRNLNFNLSESEEDEYQLKDQSVEIVDEEIFHPNIESIHSRRILNGVQEFYVKYQNLSFRHCQWKSFQDILDYDPNVKNKLNRFIRDYNQKVLIDNKPKFLNYDPNYLKIDRIIDSTELFPIIHPKKASQIQQKWSKDLLQVLNFLANFEYDNLKHGILILHISDRYMEFPEITNYVDLSIMINRVYLDYYKNPESFWNDLLDVYNNYYIINHKRSECDAGIILNRMEQLTRVAFKQWRLRHSKKYQELIDFQNKNYEENQFEEFARNFYSLFSFKGNSRGGKFIEMLQSQIEENKIFLSNFDQIFQTYQNIKREMEKLDALKKECLEKFPETIKCEGMMLLPVIVPTKEQSEFKDSIESQKITLKQYMGQIQVQITQNIEYFQKMFQKLKHLFQNQIYTNKINEIELFKSNEEIQLEWIENPEDRKIDVFKPIGRIFLVKWKQLSYTECTWEEEEFVKIFSKQLLDFRKFNRALLKDERKEYLDRFMKNQELKEIYSNQRKYARQHPRTLNYLKSVVFGMKESKKIIQYNPKNQPIYKQNKMLRSYQLGSLNWMIEAWTRRRNIILADEMGLGKTIQSMAFINHLHTVEKLNGPFMILAPLSTLQHWKRTFEEWSFLNTILYYDNNGKQGRKMCRETEWYRKDITQKGQFTQHYKIGKFQVLITSFEVFLQDFSSVFQEIPFQHIIIDEAHRLKNKNAKIIQMLRKLVCTRIFLLTGTPIQNNIGELWSLLNFIEPIHFSNLEKFKESYDDLTNIGQLEKLKESLKPYLLRRMKEDVENSIPPLSETIIDIELTKMQKMVYKTVYEKSKGTLQKGLGLKYVSMMNNLEMQLRKCCNHPYLLQGIKENIIGEEYYTQQQYEEKLFSCSGKMIFLDKLVTKFQKENKKILIFSQFTQMLKIIEEYLQIKQIHCEKIDGSTKAKERQASIDRFNNNNKGIFEVFLLSTKAGGIGINLTSAKIVIIYDSDWNPQNDVQAIARAHRIGQTEKVRVFRLVSKNTYETEMFERASKKLGLDQAIFLTGNFDSSTTNTKKKDDMNKLDPKEIELLLKKGMIGLLNQNNQQQIDEHYDVDINQVIENARVANYSFTKGTYKFSKININTISEGEKVMLNDPDFWKKAFKDSVTPASKIQKKFEEQKNNGMIKAVDNQKELIIELSEEIYKYKRDVVKNDGFCADSERIFEEVLISMQDNPSIQDSFQEVLKQLASDFKKKSRRIKKLDEKHINAILRKSLKKKGLKQDEIGKTIKTDGKSKNDIFQDSGSDYDDIKIKKKGKKTKHNLCQICYKEKPNFTCSNACKKHFHYKCIIQYTKQYGETMSQKLENSSQLLSEFANISEKDVNIFGSCYMCNHQIQQCFDCKKFDKFENQGVITDLEKEGIYDMVYKCQNCHHFYHIKCLSHNQIKIEKNNFRCPHHYCKDCGDYSNQLYRCMQCPMSFHKKCMSKRNQILKIGVISCYKHKEIPKPKKKMQDNHFSSLLEKKKNSVINNSERPQINCKIQLSKKQKTKKLKNDYKYYEIERPENFDYSNTKSPWCRICGSRYSENFYKSDFGAQSLCQTHHKMLKKGKLKIHRFEMVRNPIYPDQNTELIYLNKKNPQ